MALNELTSVCTNICSHKENAFWGSSKLNCPVSSIQLVNNYQFRVSFYFFKTGSLC